MRETRLLAHYEAEHQAVQRNVTMSLRKYGNATANELVRRGETNARSENERAWDDEEVEPTRVVAKDAVERVGPVASSLQGLETSGRAGGGRHVTYA